MISVPESIFRPILPPLPDKFQERLAAIATLDGKPLFRIVDGTRELKWRNGKHDIKHLLQHDNIPCYIPVTVTTFARKNLRTNTYKPYTSLEAAKADTDKKLSPEVKVASRTKRLPVGRACWVVEVLIQAKDISYESWIANRYQMLEKSGVTQKIDVLGEYPRDGMYIACFDVVDSEGNAVAPSERTLDECRRRFRIASGDTETAEMAIQGAYADMKRFEERQLEEMNQNFLQWAGITNTRANAGVVGKPILN